MRGESRERINFKVMLNELAGMRREGEVTHLVLVLVLLVVLVLLLLVVVVLVLVLVLLLVVVVCVEGGG